MYCKRCKQNVKIKLINERGDSPDDSDKAYYFARCTYCNYQIISDMSSRCNDCIDTSDTPQQSHGERFYVFGEEYVRNALRR